jgi:tetratricopeptide (TPR) repeat protein
VQYHVYIRFGKWNEILEIPPPEDPDTFKFTNVLHYYARGLAFAALGKTEDAEKEEQMFISLAEALPENWKIFNNTCRDISEVAKHMLRGEIEYRKGNFEEAFRQLRNSVDLDDNLAYDEPWGWMQPPRHALGALFLERGRVEEAEVVYEEDLKAHPNNFWALHGLAECLEKQGKPEAEGKKLECEKARERFDVPANASCYCRLSVQ